MKDRNLFSAIFGVVESVTKSELTNIARTLIINYYQGSEQPTSALKARESVLRYAQCRVLPKLADIRLKDRSRLDQLEHLVLKMEYEAALLDGSWPPAGEPAQPPSAVPESSSFAEALPVPPGGRINPQPEKAAPAKIKKPAAKRRSTPRKPVKRAAKKKTPPRRR